MRGKQKDDLHPDAQLVQACLHGDAPSQHRLYLLYRQQMFRMCLRYAASREEAEDFLQDGFVRVFRDLSQYRMEGPLGAWIRRVILNTTLQHLRKRKLDISNSPMTDHENNFSTNDDLPGNLDAEMLTNLIQALPDGYRTVFNMFAIEGYTHPEIAETLGITVGTSKSQLSKARALLQSQLAALHTPARI